MPDTGWLDFSTFANDAAAGSLAWSNTSNASSSNNSYATVGAAPGAGQTTQWLKATNASGLSVPAGSTITGFQLKIERHGTSTGSGISATKLAIVKGSTISSTTRDSDAWQSSDTVSEFGDSTDLWGETWTSTDIGAGVGFAIRSDFNGGVGSITISVDHMQIKIYYETPSNFLMIL